MSCCTYTATLKTYQTHLHKHAHTHFNYTSCQKRMIKQRGLYRSNLWELVGYKKYPHKSYCVYLLYDCSSGLVAIASCHSDFVGSCWNVRPRPLALWFPDLYLTTLRPANWIFLLFLLSGPETGIKSKCGRCCLSGENSSVYWQSASLIPQVSVLQCVDDVLKIIRIESYKDVRLTISQLNVISQPKQLRICKASKNKWEPLSLDCGEQNIWTCSQNLEKRRILTLSPVSLRTINWTSPASRTPSLEAQQLHSPVHTAAVCSSQQPLFWHHCSKTASFCKVCRQWLHSLLSRSGSSHFNLDIRPTLTPAFSLKQHEKGHEVRHLGGLCATPCWLLPGCKQTCWSWCWDDSLFASHAWRGQFVDAREPLVLWSQTRCEKKNSLYWNGPHHEDQDCSVWLDLSCK